MSDLLSDPDSGRPAELYVYAHDSREEVRWRVVDGTR